MTETEYYATMMPAAIHEVVDHEAARLGVDFDAVLFGPFIPRPISEYHEDMGPVLWWKFPIEEAPYVGSPNDCGITVEAHTNLLTQSNQSEEPVIARFNVGGWPGYHTHFTPIPIPVAP